MSSPPPHARAACFFSLSLRRPSRCPSPPRRARVSCGPPRRGGAGVAQPVAGQRRLQGGRPRGAHLCRPPRGRRDRPKRGQVRGGRGGLSRTGARGLVGGGGGGGRGCGGAADRRVGQRARRPPRCGVCTSARGGRRGQLRGETARATAVAWRSAPPGAAAAAGRSRGITSMAATTAVAKYSHTPTVPRPPPLPPPRPPHPPQLCECGL